MKLEIYKPLWGHVGTLTDAITQAKKAGFNGIEGPAPIDSTDRENFGLSLLESGLAYIAEVTTGGGYVPDPKRTPASHLDDLRVGIERALLLSPRFVNTQAGLDAWDFRTQIAFHEAILELESEYGIPISVETHRSRPLFHPWVTRDLLSELPALGITCDFSHWCCVTERLVMDDDPELLTLVARHCRHIHARVGYDQGPQVPDPRAPEYAEAVASHRAWWHALLEARSQRGAHLATFTPEFGTDGYLHLEPFTKKPVADLWEVNQWMAGRLRDWFG